MANVAKFPDDQARIDWLLSRTAAEGGMAPVDLERFWADQAVARADPFGRDIPQVALGIMMSGECVFDELGVGEDQWRYGTDEPWRLELNKAYNDKAEAIVGRRLLGEQAVHRRRRAARRIRGRERLARRLVVAPAGGARRGRAEGTA